MSPPPRGSRHVASPLDLLAVLVVILSYFTLKKLLEIPEDDKVG